MTARHYAITFWEDPTETKNENIRYAIYGKEICPTTGKLHWQSYIEFHKPLRFSAIKKIYNQNNCHINEKYKGSTREQARDYCKKDGEYIEYGEWIKGQGARTDIKTVVDKLKDGKKMSELMIEQPGLYCQYRNGLKDINANIIKNKTKEWRDIEVILIAGPTGCGKTKTAMKDATYKIQGTQLSWWQDYDQEECICIDEYSNDVKITELLNLLDGYQLRLSIKGSHTYANWKKVYITTNLKINEIHSEAKQAHKDALFRRITTIIDHWEENS